MGNRLIKAVLRSRSRKEPHRFGGAGAVTRCGSGFGFERLGSGSKLDVTKVDYQSYCNFCLFRKFGLVHCRVGAGAG
jgi:hypothetical protein